MFDILPKLKPKNYENHSLKLYGKLEVKHNERTGQFILKNKSQSKWSERSVLRNSVQKWNNLPNKIRKENSKIKFKEKIKKRADTKTPARQHPQTNVIPVCQHAKKMFNYQQT